MRCSKARELFFSSHDGLLDESQRMKLNAHLARCPQCARFVQEMEASFGMLKGLPELTPSDNFEWNLKRRILQEKSRLIRQAGSLRLPDIRWGMKFAASAAAAIAVTLVGAWLMFADHPGVPGETRLAERPAAARSQAGASMQPSGRDFTGLDRSAVMRMVSDDGPGGARQHGSAGPQAFQDASASREDSLLRENEKLKLYIQMLERDNLILKQYLYRARARR